MLEVENLRISYKTVEAVHGVSFNIKSGELVSIIGANGAGKTSILNSIMGLIPSQQGSKILFDGVPIEQYPAHIRARQGIRIVPERARVFPYLSIYENLMVGLYKIKNTINVEEQLEWLYSFFPILAERKKQSAKTLSGGEQQQLAIARALISNPKLLLVDEISMGLMPKLVEKVFEVLKQLNQEHNLTILIVEQNALASLKISDRGYVLEAGKIDIEGQADRLIQDDRIREAYLGL